MAFEMPVYTAPDFSCEPFANAPDALLAPVANEGVAPARYHSTSMYPEYFKVGGEWLLAQRSRMDSCVVYRESLRGMICEAGYALNGIEVVEPRNLHVGDLVVLGRSEDASEGIFVHADGFHVPGEEYDAHDAFVFRQGRSRETAYARDYDRLFELLRHEREHGNVAWVMGPAFAFDFDARNAMQALIENGFADSLLAGNALATHDLEGAVLRTALGQDIYTQRLRPLGHYNHLDVINGVREAGSIAAYIEREGVSDGIMYALEKHGVPYVLAGSIRDDGPLPEVIGDVYEAQGAMRAALSRATTVICQATMLHTIAAGNITPSYCCVADASRPEGYEVRPVFFYAVDADEFVVNKLLDRGSLTATTIVTNVQDFITIVARGLKVF